MHYFLHKSGLALITALLLLASAQTTRAQMFSVQTTEDRAERPTPGNALAFALDFTSFDYFGPTGEDAPEFNYDFAAPVYRLQYESNLVNLYFGFGGSLGPEDEIRYTQIGVGLKTVIPMYMREHIRLSIPLALNTDYTLVRTSDTANTTDEFGQNSAYFGAGFGVELRPSEGFRLTSRSLPHIGFTTDSFGSSGGVSWKLSQELRFYLDNLVGNFGLTLGYDFRLIRFDNNNRDFDYDLISNGVVIGITF